MKGIVAKKRISMNLVIEDASIHKEFNADRHMKS